MERFWQALSYFVIGVLIGILVCTSRPAHGAPAKPLTVTVCPGLQASFRYDKGVMYVTCPPDPVPVLTVYGCVGPSLERNKTPGPKGYDYTFHCQSWTTTVQPPK